MWALFELDQEDHPTAETGSWHFAPFRLDLGAERLWRGTEAVRLTAKAWGVLCFLVTPAGQLVSKEALCAAGWKAPPVSDASLAVCVRELRQALGDTAYERSDQRFQATAALSTAVDLYQSMAMTFWLPQAGQDLARVSQEQAGGLRSK